MKNILVLIFTLMTLCLFDFSASAYETDIFKIDIPEEFSTLTENDVEGSKVMLWTDSSDNSNVSITVCQNDGYCYADLTDVQKASVNSSFISQVEREIIDSLKIYSIGYKITDSTSNNVEINGSKGLELIYNSVYTYEDGSTLQSKNYAYLFSSENNAITITALINDEEKLYLVEELINSFEFKEEVYFISEVDESASFDSYELVKWVLVGAAGGGAVGLFIAKRKKSAPETNLPV